MTNRPKVTRPETLAEARTFTTRSNRYRAAGLCPRCAAQASYGHTHGFNQVHRPCKSCAPIVAQLPTPAPNGWRKTVDAKPQGPSKAPSSSANAPAGVPGTPAPPSPKTAPVRRSPGLGGPTTNQAHTP